MRYARKYFDVDAGADRATFVSFGWFSQYCRYGILPTLSARQVQLLNVCCTIYCICPRLSVDLKSFLADHGFLEAEMATTFTPVPPCKMSTPPALFHTSEAILLHEVHVQENIRSVSGIYTEHKSPMGNFHRNVPTRCHNSFPACFNDSIGV
jgi:hypothetical protein